MTLNWTVSICMQIILKTKRVFLQNNVFEVGDHCNLRTAWPISLKIFSLILYIIVLRMDKGFFFGRLFFFITENMTEILVE